MNRDYETLRALGREIREIAELPAQEEKRRLWKSLNGLRECRPLVLIDQLPWNELDSVPEMRCACEDPDLRKLEWGLRSKLYRWKHFPADMVVEARVEIEKTHKNLHYGLHVKKRVSSTGAENSIVAQKYEDQVKTPEELEKLQPEKILIDPDLDARRLSLMEEIFCGILPVKLVGVTIHSGAWDRITMMRSADSIIYDCADRPEFIALLAEKFRDLTMDTVDQCEALGLLDAEQTSIHCAGAYTDELPGEGYYPPAPKAIDCWSYAMAQIFSTVSPSMHEEFEIDIMRPLYERFGLLYYGCCEPLDR